MNDRTRPSDQVRSYQLTWKGNNPTVQESHWQPGYTEAHKATIEEAIQEGMAQLTKTIADDRERWIKINMLVAELVAR